MTPRSNETTAWEWGLELTGYGDANHVSAVEAPAVQAAGNRIEYRRGAITEWYINDERGLEQGFTLFASPISGSAAESGQTAAASQLRLELTYTGNVVPRINADGSEIEFLNANGVKVLRYNTLYVTDASAKVLPARFALHKAQSQFSILVDVSAAQFPITDDPLITSPDWRVQGVQSYSGFGISVSTAGDVNGDGYSDVIVGAPYYDYGDGINNGAVFVYYGSATGLSAEANWAVEGEYGSLLGWSVNTAGDVNGDGYSDILIGAIGYNSGTYTGSEGQVQVYYGSHSGLSASSSPSWLAVGDRSDSLFGYAVGTAGDVNRDGYSDVMISALDYYQEGSRHWGKVFVYYGAATGLGTEGNPENADWSAENDQNNISSDWFGYCVGTAGDVNGDGADDIIIGDPCYEPDDTIFSYGTAFVWYGSPSVGLGENSLSTNADWRVIGDEGEEKMQLMGWSVSTAGDVNGDGYDDIIIGDYWYDGDDDRRGMVLAWYGSSDGLGPDGTSANADWLYTEINVDDYDTEFGSTVQTAGDVNGDGYADVIVGAPDWEGEGAKVGRAFLYYGSEEGLQSSQGLAISAEYWLSENDEQVLGTAGDVNGDGYSDIVIGEYLYRSSTSTPRVGRVSVYHGAPAGALERPQSDLGSLEGDLAAMSGSDAPGVADCDSTRGAMPCWQVNMINLNLYAKSLPLWYTPPIGPAVALTLYYNSQAGERFLEPLGPKWQLSYSSYLVEDDDGNVTVVMPDGQEDTYGLNGTSYTPPTQIFNTLTRVEDQHFELQFLDDMVYVYQIPSGSGLEYPVLVAIHDAHEQQVTFHYNENGELERMTDALNRHTFLSYNSEGLLREVHDPFGRVASFEYYKYSPTPIGCLKKITDMGGYAVDLDYQLYTHPEDATQSEYFLAGIEDPRSRWEFLTEPADDTDIGDVTYPAPGDPMGKNYRLTITDPEEGQAEYYYNSATRQSWSVSPRHYVEYADAETNNAADDVHKTMYDLKVTKTKAGDYGDVRKVTTPQQVLIGYGYDAQRNRLSVQDTLNHSYRYSYNALGQVTSVTPPESENILLGYAENGVDLRTITTSLGAIQLDYNNAHQVTEVTDRLEKTTELTYNEYGQLTQTLDPLQITTRYQYDANTHLLTEITRDDQSLAQFSYDDYDRVQTVTDATGLTLTYSYTDLDQVTSVSYPDEKAVTYTYATNVPLLESSTDRAGRSTTFTYDDLKRVTEVNNPEEGITEYIYDANSNLTELTDPEEHTTTFEYDDDDRLVKKIYHDEKAIEWTYNAVDLVEQVTNARQTTIHYRYDDEGKVVEVAYSDDTPAVTFTYDEHNRLQQREDGIGAWVFDYDANSRLTSVDGPWALDTLSYTYDDLGRREHLTPQDGTQLTYGYDTLNRLVTIQTDDGAYTYSYSGASPLVQSLTRPNGSVTNYTYDQINRLEQIAHRTSANELISSHSYTYSNDLREHETIENGLTLPTVSSGELTYTYNDVNQLTGSTNPARTYIYDDDGNLTQGYTPDGEVFSAEYDAQNRLISLEYGQRIIKYAYSGDDFLAEISTYTTSSGEPVLEEEIRIVRDGMLPLQDRSPLALGGSEILREYTWGQHLGGGIGGLLNLKQDDADYAYLYDGKGNVEAVLDSAQNVVAAYRYDPFGNILAATGTLEQPFQFSTKRYDAATGLVYYGRRFYSPAMDRWTTRDPLGEKGGLNLYAFVGNNPVNWVDPWGLSHDDYLKILITFMNAVEKMTKEGKRHPNPMINNILSSAYLLVVAERLSCQNPMMGCYKLPKIELPFPRYLGCGEQWMELKKELKKNTYDAHWEFNLDQTTSWGFYHERGIAISDDSNDPKLILDPMHNSIEQE